MNRLNEIEARANAATEGPWEWEGEAKAEWEIGANSLVPSRRPDDPVLYGYGPSLLLAGQNDRSSGRGS